MQWNENSFCFLYATQLGRLAQFHLQSSCTAAQPREFFFVERKRVVRSCGESGKCRHLPIGGPDPRRLPGRDGGTEGAAGGAAHASVSRTNWVNVARRADTARAHNSARPSRCFRISITR